MPPELPVTKKRSWLAHQWYQLVRTTCMALLSITCGVRATGRKQIPKHGSCLLMANHASYYDVILLGIAQRRDVDFMARSGLFIPLLGPMIRSMGAFAIQREGGGASGIKETLKRLKQGAMVGLFPEGTRTHDGRMSPLKPGISNIARKSGCQIICAGIAGSFEAWPRSQPWPGSHPFHVHYSELISPSELAEMTEAEAMACMESRLRSAQAVSEAALKRLRHYSTY